MRILPAHQLIEAALDGRDVEQRAVGEAIVLAYVDLERPVVYPPITAHRGGLGRAVPPHAHELLDRIVRYPEPVTAAGSTTRFVPTGSYRRARWFAPKAFGAEVVRMSLIEVTLPLAARAETRTSTASTRRRFAISRAVPFSWTTKSPEGIFQGLGRNVRRAIDCRTVTWPAATGP